MRSQSAAARVRRPLALGKTSKRIAAVAVGLLAMDAIAAVVTAALGWGILNR